MSEPTFEELRSRAEAWTAPISEAAPAGASAKFDPAYEAIGREMAKLDSPLDVPVDWAMVIEKGGNLLKRTSKDLLIAAYLANGLFVTKGMTGLTTGLVLIADLIARYWPTMFPEVGRLKARGNALGWVLERVVLPLDAPQAKAAGRADVEALQVAAKQLAEVGRQSFGSAAPAFGPLLEAVERLRISLPVEAPPPTSNVGPSQGPTPPAMGSAEQSSSAPDAIATSSQSPAFVAPAAPEAGGDVTDFLRNLGTALAGAAGPARRANSADPTPYRMLRVGLYLHVSAPPPVSGGKTRVPPLAPAIRTKLDLMAGNGKWPELLDEAESALVQARFCLDLHRYTAQALAGLGEGHAGARQTVIAEVASLVRRLPDWPALFAADGAPLASRDTRSWLDDEVAARPPGGGGAAGPGANGSGSGAGAAAQLGEARKLAAAGKLAEALAMSQLAVSAAPTGLARFTVRIEMAELAAGAGQPSLARVIYEDLDREMGQRGLESWDPPLAVRCLEGLLTVLRLGSKSASGVKGGVEPAAVSVIYDRLCRLDPAAVLRLGA